MIKKRLLFSLAAISIATLVIIGNVNANESNMNAENVSYTSQKSIHDIKNDGWIYLFEINYQNNVNDKKLYIFDGYNLKYDKLDGYYIPVIDSTTGKEVDRVIPNYITLGISEKYKEDIKKISDFFNEKQFTNKITLKDLNSLNIKNFDKNYLVNMFNKCLDEELKTQPGEYYESSFVDKVNVESTDNNMDGTWQLSYLLDFGYIYDVDIEFISNKNDYLSDDKLNVSNKEEIINYINNLEENIIKNQSFKTPNTLNNNVKKSSNNISGHISSDINSLLSAADENINKTN